MSFKKVLLITPEEFQEIKNSRPGCTSKTDAQLEKQKMQSEMKKALKGENNNPAHQLLKYNAALNSYFNYQKKQNGSKVSNHRLEYEPMEVDNVKQPVDSLPIPRTTGKDPPILWTSGKDRQRTQPSISPQSMSPPDSPRSLSPPDSPRSLSPPYPPFPPYPPSQLDSNHFSDEEELPPLPISSKKKKKKLQPVVMPLRYSKRKAAKLRKKPKDLQDGRGPAKNQHTPSWEWL
jgi:hypothetical protein